jgi:hypothetical protein
MAGMAGEVFVDVTYRGLELGRRLKLREVGPSTAYLEHGTPMPVGAQVLLSTEQGLSIPVTVVRVHEQVAGAEMPPGMRVQASGLEGAAASWWRDLISRDDPQIPEQEVAPMRRSRPLEPPPMAPPPSAEPPAPPAAREETSPVVDEAPVPEDERPTTIMNAVSPPDDGGETDPGAPRAGNGHADHSPSRTTVMTAQEIREALGTDPAAQAPTGSGDDENTSSGNGETGADDRGRGKGRRRRRRR